ncbi:GINS complex Psf3 component [Multifurca ochricompacta]|uniref:DNA replication complex GINS protein PSF3 n=1 Tax=Multifurca ochricompacta TaxID=376703 RepID=A0AAD4QSI9_9AGAM|nr:GINS complex Psf3 component [Multifurca ochricompacta]
MEDDYYSIDSILAENQKIQCTFKVDIPDMGHLDGGHERDIKAQSKVQLPLWLAFIIIYSDYADFTIPPPFSLRVRKALNAEAKSVKLSALVGAGGLWYGFGKIIMRLLDDAPASEMSELLTKTFQSRLVEVIDQAQHFAALGPAGGGGQSGDAALMFREGLEVTERELFLLAQESAKKIKQWYGSTDRLRR